MSRLTPDFLPRQEFPHVTSRGSSFSQLDLALVVTSVALIAIGIGLNIYTAYLGNAQALMHYGAIGLKCLEYLILASGAILGSIEINRLIRSTKEYYKLFHYPKSGIQKTPIDEMRSDIMTSYGDTSDTDIEGIVSYLLDEEESGGDVETTVHEEGKQVESRVKTFEDDTVHWWDIKEPDVHPSQCTFSLNGKLAVLYGIYETDPSKIEELERSIVSKLREMPGLEDEELKKKLQDLLEEKHHDVVLHVGNTVLVSARKYFVLTDQERSLHKGPRTHQLYKVETHQKLVFILGDSDTLDSFTLANVHDALEEETKKAVAFKLLHHLPDLEMAFMLLDFGNSFKK